MKNPKSDLVGGRTVEQWAAELVDVKNWLNPESYDLHGQVGMILFSKGGRIVAYALGTELKGGLRKRTADFFRDSESGRNYPTGRRIYTERDAITVQVLITGSDPIAQSHARKLKAKMMKLRPPVWHHEPLAKRKWSKRRGAKIKVQRPPSIKTVSSAEVVVAQPA